MKLELKELIAALDDTVKSSLENAAQRCILRGGNEILIEDLLFVMCENEDALFKALLEQYNIKTQDMKDALLHGVKISSSESSSPVFSSALISFLEDAFYISKMNLDLSYITAASLILSLFENSLKYLHTKYFILLKDISFDEVKALLKGLNEGAKTQENQNKTKQANKKVESDLEKYTTNLTTMAKNNEIDPVLCRDEEIKQAIDILLRRRKNNPIIVGEAGVGKTAVVEGLALKIINKEVPNYLFDAQILSLDLGALQAGASVKGEFERRLQAVIQEIQSSKSFIILFIDEAHNLIGAGGSEGSGDAANLLKPALARGNLKTIAATTWLEYRKYFEKDAALSRRFQKIDLLEPTVPQAVTIIRGLASKYEEVHGVYIEDEAIKAAASLAARYITGRQLPDKAIDVLDTACANVKISKSNEPFELVKLKTKIQEVQRQRDYILRDNEQELKDYTKEIKELDKQITKLKKEEALIQKNWIKQKDAMSELEDALLEANKSKIQKAKKKLNELQSENTYIYKNVTKNQIAQVISSWTGIPLGNMAVEQVSDVLSLEKKMKERIIGQDGAISYLNKFLQISTAGLKKENAPTGVFLLVGPSGVGKTETALSIADLLYGGERFITTINMTEFQEKHTVSRLIGSPPGYVGYGDGGQLTDPVRVKPYSVVLLDEIEKAHPDVLNIFYQMFDKGVLNDGEGREIDFSNTIILMTSNLATHEITQLCTQNENITLDEVSKEITPVLSTYLKPALLGRMNVIPYFNLKEDSLKQIAKLKLKFIENQLLKKEIKFSYSEDILSYIISLSNALDTGARNIELIINTNLMPLLSSKILDAAVKKEEIKSIKILINKNNELEIRSS